MSKDKLVDMMNDAEWFRKDAAEQMKKRPSERVGISTGWPLMDYYMRGFHPGKLYVVGARPGDGKTSFGTTITANILGHAKTWGPVLYFSTELGVNEVGFQVMESRAGGTALFPNGRTLRAYETDRLVEAADEVEMWMMARNLVIIHETGLTLSHIGSTISEFRDGHHDGKVAMVIIDQSDRIKRTVTPGIATNYTVATADMVHEIEIMADDVGCPILLISQANRDAVKGGGRAMMHHLKHSGAFEEKAHCVMMLERNDLDGDAIWIEKNRSGQVAKVPARFIGEAHTWEVIDDRPKGNPEHERDD